MTETFEQALHLAYPKVLAWDINPRDGQHTLSVFDLSTGGARQVTWRRHAADEVDTISHTLAEAGHVLGHYDGHQPFVWSIAPDSITVWSPDERVLLAQADTLTITYDRTFARTDIVEVIGYVETDYVDRGLKVRRSDGTLATVLFDLSIGASGNPTYNRNDMLMETEWIPTIGTALAHWAGVPYRGHL